MATFSKSEFGNRLRKRRIAAGFLRQQDLADAVGVTTASISYYESGTRMPDAESLAKITQSLDCTADYLTQREDAPTHALADIVEATGLTHEAIAKLVSAEKDPPISLLGNDNFMAHFLSELICSQEFHEILPLFLVGNRLYHKIWEIQLIDSQRSISNDDQILLDAFQLDDNKSPAVFKDELLQLAAKHKAMDALGKFFDYFVEACPIAEDGVEF